MTDFGEASPHKDENATALRDKSRFRNSGLLAALALPYLSLVLWLSVGGELSGRGLWPHWSRTGLGNIPDQKWAGWIVGTYFCALPLFALIGALYSIVESCRIVTKSRVVLLWLIPEAIVVVSLVGFYVWLIKAA